MGVKALIRYLFCKSYYYQLISMDISGSQVKQKLQAEVKQLQILNQFYLKTQAMKKVKKTIVLYYVYVLKGERQTNKDRIVQMSILNNMNTFAHFILNNTLNVDVKKSNTKPSYTLSPDDKNKSEQQLNHERYLIQQISQYDIHTYQKQNLRVVVLPVERQLLSLRQIDQNRQIQQYEKSSHEQFFTKNPQTKQKRQQLKQIQKREFDARFQKAYTYHMQTYKCQDLYSLLMEKTQTISFVSILKYKSALQSEEKKILKQFKLIFQAKTEIRPRLLVYYSNREGGSESDDQREDLENLLSEKNCAALFTHEKVKEMKKKVQAQEQGQQVKKQKAQVKKQKAHKLKVIQGKYKVEDNKYFYSKQQIRLNLYINLKQAKSNPIHKAMRQFIDNLRSITTNTIGAIPSVFKEVNRSLGPDSIIYKKQYRSFANIDADYDIKQLKLPAVSILNNHYTKKNVGLVKEKVKEDKKENKKEGEKQADQSKASDANQPVEIPSCLNNLVFIHCFNKIKENALKLDLEARFDVEKRLKNWISIFKDLFDLINTLFKSIKLLKDKKQIIGKQPATSPTKTSQQDNKSPVKNTKHQKVDEKSQIVSSQKKIAIQQQNNSLVGLQIYEDVQGYYDFLCFLFRQIQKFNVTLNEGAQFVDQFKAVLSGLTINSQKIIKYIIDHQQNIRSNQNLIYYDLMQLLINQNKGNATRDKLDYIQCHILQLKAFQIASNYIYDEKRIVQAIKGYAYVALKYKDLPETKKQLINLFQIQIKVARLLKIIGQQEEAAKVYFCLKMFGQAHKLYNYIRLKHLGDSRAKKLKEWGKKFENQLQFQIAIEFYRNAFDSAESVDEKVQATKFKRECIKRRRREQTEEEIRAVDKFISKGDLTTYTNQLQLEQLFKRIENLNWSSTDQCAIFS